VLKALKACEWLIGGGFDPAHHGRGAGRSAAQGFLLLVATDL
jgi:hypothetical protein